MACQLKDQLDGFFIKQELKWTAFTAFVCLPFWYVLNNLEFLESFNDSTSL
eukprot:UN26268